MPMPEGHFRKFVSKLAAPHRSPPCRPPPPPTSSRCTTAVVARPRGRTAPSGRPPSRRPAGWRPGSLPTPACGAHRPGPGPTAVRCGSLVHTGRITALITPLSSRSRDIARSCRRMDLHLSRSLKIGTQV